VKVKTDDSTPLTANLFTKIEIPDIMLVIRMNRTPLFCMPKCKSVLFIKFAERNV
jgi:hypothetical protein